MADIQHSPRTSTDREPLDLNGISVAGLSRSEPVFDRRRVLVGLAAAPAAALVLASTAEADTGDGALLSIEQEIRRLAALCADTFAEVHAAETRAEEARFERPEALRVQIRDEHFLFPEGPAGGSHYGAPEVRQIRSLTGHRRGHTVHLPEGDLEIFPQVAAEGWRERRAEVLAAWDRHQARCEAVERELGLENLQERWDGALSAAMSAVTAMAGIPAKSHAGILAKARVVRAVYEVDGCADRGERAPFDLLGSIAEDVLAMGEAAAG